ncbi:hypothetical protein BDQ94DRAFT_139620 [Aspergillus welwitschiae]|uniref:Uncharacterized protein n=1 Tax=Aspergillus welwitschiae TaxID=1341132 RepID=A0A3F3Q8B7_9EURO|nr:hypothetical protein BDQ94DRAFT_139620 [Aspergillus welwitschiae]RDH35451.1 hypothetical protein BDQ94DRAFT_139620 [Aspergillus welwitschiae]
MLALGTLSSLYSLPWFGCAGGVCLCPIPYPTLLTYSRQLSHLREEGCRVSPPPPPPPLPSQPASPSDTRK